MLPCQLYSLCLVTECPCHYGLYFPAWNLVCGMYFFAESAKKYRKGNWLEHLQLAEQQQDHKDDKNQADAPADVMSAAVERPATDTGEAAKQHDDQDNY